MEHLEIAYILNAWIVHIAHLYIDWLHNRAIGLRQLLYIYHTSEYICIYVFVYNLIDFLLLFGITWIYLPESKCEALSQFEYKNHYHCETTTIERQWIGKQIGILLPWSMAME